MDTHPQDRDAVRGQYARSFRSATSMQDIIGIEEKDLRKTMIQISDIVKKFFEDFERGSNTFERDLLALQFSDPFVTADPDAAIRVVKKDDFLAGISQRKAFSLHRFSIRQNPIT